MRLIVGLGNGFFGRGSRHGLGLTLMERLADTHAASWCGDECSQPQSCTHVLPSCLISRRHCCRSLHPRLCAYLAQLPANATDMSTDAAASQASELEPEPELDSRPTALHATTAAAVGSTGGCSGDDLAGVCGGGVVVWLVWPVLPYNTAGWSVGAAARYLGVVDYSADVTVVHDDLELAAGRLSFRCGGSLGGSEYQPSPPPAMVAIGMRPWCEG